MISGVPETFKEVHEVRRGDTLFVNICPGPDDEPAGI
jgi:hypothetical protein